MGRIAFGEKDGDHRQSLHEVFLARFVPTGKLFLILQE
jgi:hypothetical protein